MKTLFLFLIAFLSIGSSFGRNDCPEGRQHIFLVHGIGGGKGSFGHMKEYLQNVSHCYATYAFEYDTGSFTKSPIEFSQEFDAFVDHILLENDFKGNDRISLVMHSQGGLVGSFWLRLLMTNKPDLFKKIDAFITLSTPYWGSSAARVGEAFFYTLPDNVRNPISPFGRAELEGMKYGSNNINQIEKNFETVLGRTHVRALAIGGVRPGHSIHGYEDDNTVTVYSSRPDHYILNESLNLSGEAKTITADDFRFTDYVPFIPVRANHFKMELPGVANVPYLCIIDSDCDHPSIRHIVDHLAGKKVSRTDGMQFKKYRIHFYLENVLGTNLKALDFSVKITKTDSDSESEIFEVGQGGSLGFSFSGKNRSVKEEYADIKLYYQKKLLRSYRVPVRGGYSTFIRAHVNREPSVSAR